MPTTRTHAQVLETANKQHKQWWRSRISHTIALWTCIVFLLIESVALITEFSFKKQDLIDQLEAKAQASIGELLREPRPDGIENPPPPSAISALNVYNEDDRLMWSLGASSSWVDANHLHRTWQYSIDGSSVRVVAILNFAQLNGELYQELLSQFSIILIIAFGVMLGSWITVNLLVVKTAT